MSTAQTDFENWFVKSLNPLRDNGDAGFIFALVAFPLLERYLRNKSRNPEGEALKEPFYTALGEEIKEVKGKEHPFWECYRNGLLHQVTFPKKKRDRKGIWVELPAAGLSGHDLKPVYCDQSAGFFLNPVAFFDHVKDMILKDFSTYEMANPSTQYPLPAVGTPSTAQPKTVPTINIPIMVSGSQVMKNDPKSG